MAKNKKFNSNNNSLTKRDRRNRRNRNRRKIKHQDLVNNYQIKKLVEESRIDDETWEGIVKKDIIHKTPIKPNNFIYNFYSYIHSFFF